MRYQEGGKSAADLTVFRERGHCFASPPPIGGLLRTDYRWMFATSTMVCLFMRPWLLEYHWKRKLLRRNKTPFRVGCLAETWNECIFGPEFGKGTNSFTWKLRGRCRKICMWEFMRIDGNGKRKAEFIYIPAKCQQTVYITTENFADTRLHVMFFGGLWYCWYLDNLLVLQGSLEIYIRAIFVCRFV